MEKTGSQALSAALLRMLRPLVRLLLRRGVTFKAFSDLLRWLFVDVAMEEFGLSGRRQSISRVSVVTGLTRKEVSRLINLPAQRDQVSSDKYNRLARVIAGWRRDPDFRDKRGTAASLGIKGEGLTFSELVRRYSGDMTPRSVMDELLRIGAVKVLRNGRLKLTVRSFVPGRENEVKIHILGTDVGHLISTIDHNLNLDASTSEKPFFQRKVLYDNLPAEALKEFQILSEEASQKLLERLDAWLAERDRDNNPQIEGTGRHAAGIGIYYFEEPYKED
jgi:hypothetical protein